jgi:hypothetical protein
LYGENINLDEIVKEFKMKSGELEIEMKQKAFEDLIKNNFIEATKGMDKLFLMDKNLGDSLINDIIKGLENSTIFEILKFGNKILNPKEIISIKDIKFLNLRGNKISNIDFLLNKDFGNLEILSLNNNEIESIDISQIDMMNTLDITLNNYDPDVSYTIELLYKPENTITNEINVISKKVTIEDIGGNILDYEIH